MYRHIFPPLDLAERDAWAEGERDVDGIDIDAVAVAASRAAARGLTPANTARCS